ncbi:MAG: gliding motility-associated C-terminal domain-containing protein, partial [Bacteroidia bacterium]|nr:gliding motility-associated C-terminal domain-containing protein [Bacteroidia bacterium]
GTVTDSHGCSTTTAVTVVAPVPLSVTLTPFNPLCNAACNGSITTAVSGAQGTVAYVWAPAGTGQNPTGLCAVVNPNYTLVATDSKSCQVTSVVTLTNPPAMLASVSVTNPVCHNDLNGLAAVSVSNAVGATNYTWSPTAPTKTTQSVSGLGSGSYTVFVRDANTCTANATFTLTNPLAITIGSLLSNPTCLQSNGSITVTATGGTTLLPAPYTYSWSGGLGTSPVVSGLGAGVYSVTAFDSYSCSTMGTVNLSNANGPTGGSIATNSVSCYGQCTGSATLDVSTINGGTSPYTIEWQSPATTTANPTSSLCAGNYVAKIIDATGCISFTNTTISEPLPVSISNSLASFPLCPGICDGTIALNVSGGIAPYTYTWNPISSNAASETSLCAGDYTVTIGYNGTCQETVSFSMPIQTSITIVPSVTNNICFGDCNGIATVSVSGGTGPYQASWSNAQNGMFANGLCNGDYTVSISDSFGCNNTATTSISSAAQITSTASVTQPSCGLCDGTAALDVSGGTGPYTFNWSNAATTPSISNLCAGVYQVVISDALSCSQSNTVIVNNSNGITGETFNVTEIPCSGQCVGGISVTAVGGTAPIAYNWLMTPANTTSVANNLCPGTYFIQMTDAQGCVRTASMGINPLVTLTVSPFVQQPSCNASNGSLQIVIAGGTPSYSIVWNPPATNTTALTGLNTGIYSYTVTESGTHSCSVSNTVVISNANGPISSATQTNVNCFGGDNGAVSVSATSPSMPLTYLWSTGATNSFVTNLGGSILTLTITDAALCKTIQSFTITQGAEMFLGFSNVNNPTCFGDCNGVITLLPSGGTLPYSYNWSSSVTTNPATSLCDGTYTAEVIDALGCTIKSPTFTIASASSMSITSNKTDPSCSATNDGVINLTLTGGSPSYAFNWQGPSAFTATTQNISNIYFGSYTVTVTDSLGCLKDSVLNVVPTITVIANAGFDAIVCPITGTAVLDASASAGAANYKWALLGQSGATLATTPNYTVSNLTQPTSFVVIATSSVPACFDVDTVVVDVHNLPIVDAGGSAMVPVYSSVTIGGNPTSISAVSLTWSPAQYLDNPNAFNPVATNTINVTYTVTVTDLNGCIESGTVAVNLFPELNISNGFTPNGDGKNDTWIIDYIEQFPDNTVEIFNRWGDIIFTSKGYQTPFDGKYKGGDLPVGTYYYIIHLNHPGYPKPITGPITIFR